MADKVTAEEFLAGKLSKTQAELGGAILNRGRWDVLCEERRLLMFLQQRASALDFQDIPTELRRIAAGGVRVPQIGGPRRKAEHCLRAWAGELENLK